ncbi:hypothetical protein [Vibrio algivorus]|uniref:Uncharacterized protein n=1 Tax=Vibrio algivorus TaxID=1667024 RepID=A0ABQ6EQN3_9VIBR|nr:hypothetical protein [Vibrio algivorus]GLT15487.1 hypothetical protein GCM10007931_24620 [Vibrio algivorus]
MANSSIPRNPQQIQIFLFQAPCVPVISAAHHVSLTRLSIIQRNTIAITLGFSYVD